MPGKAPSPGHKVSLTARVTRLYRPHRSAILLVAILVVFSAGASVLPPLLTQSLFDQALFPVGGGPVDTTLLFQLSVAILAIYVITAIATVWQTYLTTKVGSKVVSALRVQLFEHLQSMEFGFFANTRTGEIQSRLQNDIGGVAGVLSNTVASVLGNLIQVIASLVAMFWLDWRLACIAVVLTPPLVLVQRRVGRALANIVTQTQESLAEMSAITQESLSVSGMLLSKLFSRSAQETERYATESARQAELQVREATRIQWFMGVVQILLSMIPIVVYIAAGFFATTGVDVISAGTIVAFTAVQSRLLFPLAGLLHTGVDVRASQGLFTRVFEYLDLVPAIREASNARDISRVSAPISVCFRDVDFRYPGLSDDAPSTLSGVSFEIPKGTSAAFVGASGAGKTTISYLIPRLYDVTSGAVIVNGHNVRAIRHKSLTQHVGVVSQEPYLFHATIAENLRYAKPSASQQELEQACIAANIHESIIKFDSGYATVVGERGYRLSAGEKQRIAIARILLKDPAVLLLDEATSALDSVSEAAVQDALDVAKAGRTTIAIAHRLATVVDADQIFVVDGGSIIERGRHAELLEAGGAYARLYLGRASDHEGVFPKSR